MTDLVPEPLSRRLLRRLPILLILVAAVVALVWFRDLLSFDNLARHRMALLALRDAHYALTSLAFIALYTLVVVISLPGAIILTLSGGFLFGLFPGVVYNVVAATVGAAAWRISGYRRTNVATRRRPPSLAV